MIRHYLKQFSWTEICVVIYLFKHHLSSFVSRVSLSIARKKKKKKKTKKTNKKKMSSNEDPVEDVVSNGDSFQKVKQRLKDRSKKVAQTKEMLSKQANQTKEILSKQAVKIAKQAEEHQSFLSKVTHLLGVLGFGGFCFLLGARPQDIPYVYCLFYVIFVPLRWIYYRFKKWHYYLLDFCYYANTIFLVDLLLYPKDEKLFMICFSFAEGPLAWALIVWRCSLVFSSVDKLVSVLIHLLPGLVFFTIRWWNPATFEAMHPEGTSQRASWPYVVEDKSFLLTWLFWVPLVAYTLWQVLYFLIVNVLRRQRLLRDPEVMTSYRELSKKAQKANNIWWRLSGLLGDQNRMFMYILLQAIFTVATMGLTVPIFMSYELHAVFQILKVSAAVWNGGSFLLDVMPRQVILKEKKKSEMQAAPTQQDQCPNVMENTMIIDSDGVGCTES
ncbi:glycerophosphocholine acyltransferase 1 [Hevea brasiliensis]|nr:glycerophosphocholine acyltransferase 1 [Hevea brasiliensis]